MYVIGWIAQSGQVQDFWQGVLKGWSVSVDKAEVYNTLEIANSVANGWNEGEVQILTLDEARQIEVLLCM